MNLLLDTNILLHISRHPEQDLLKKIVSPRYKRAFVSIASIGEIRSIAFQNAWGKKRSDSLDLILVDANIIEINEDLVETYIQIDSFSQRRNPTFQNYLFDTPRNMGKNDLWIAATATLLGLTLVTTDADFAHLHDVFLDVLHVNPKALLS